MSERKCVACGEMKDTNELIKITKQSSTGNVVINHDTKIFGRSAYLCYNSTCKELALKKNKINRVLKTNTDLKGILDEQFKS